MMTLTMRAKMLIAYLVSGWRKKVITGAFILLTLAVIVQLLYTNRVDLSFYISQSRPAYLVLAILTFVFDLLLALLGWHLLVSRFTSISSIRLNTKINLTSNLAKRIPGSVWYVANRAIMYEEFGVRKRQVAMLSALEIALFVCSGIFVTLLTLPFWTMPAAIWSNIPSTWSVPIVVMGAALVLHPRMLRLIWGFVADEESAPSASWGTSVIWILLYASTWVVGGIVLFYTVSFFIETPLTSLITLIGMWSFAGVISLVGFVSLPGFGLREVSLVVLLSQLMPIPLALLVGIAIRLIWLTGELFFAVLALKL